MTPDRPHIRPKWVIFAALSLTAAPLASQVPANDAQLAASKQALGEGRFIEALAAAKDAARIDDSDHRAHYYVALAYMSLKQFDAASSEASRALQLAPESARPAVEKLVATIASLTKGTSSIQSAESALADGLVGKAARLYEEAWSAGRNAPEYAFKAADLYATRLGQPVDAGRLLREVQQAMPNSAEADRAAAELKKIAPALRQIAADRVAAAAKLDWATAQGDLDAAILADPDYAEAYRVRTRLAAATGSFDIVAPALKDLARRNLVTLDELGRLPGMRQLIGEPRFEELMRDMIGTEQLAALKLRLSPQGRVLALGQLARDGKLQLFVGARRSGNQYFTWSRRQISDMQISAACHVTIFLGMTIGNSADVSVGLPSRDLDWSRVEGIVVEQDFVGLGRAIDGWEMVGFNIVNAAGITNDVAQAVQVLRDSCPRAPARNQR